MSIKRIAVIMAMMAEAKPFIDRLDLKKHIDVFPRGVPMEAYNGEIRGSEIFLVWNGKDSDYNVDNVATQPATLSAYLTVQTFKPDIVISAGTAGGLAKRGGEIGDVYLSCGKFRYYDRRIPYTDFPKYGIGSYPSLDVSAIARDLNLKMGEVTTGNSLETIEKDLQIIESYQASIKEMEAAAIAWVCRLFGTPMFAVKAIVDLLDVEEPSHEQFSDNLAMGSANLQKVIIDVLEYCAGKNVAQLAA
jgi:5'-methylthioadenosine/S-adenosylhomocysteine nucleosidase